MFIPDKSIFSLQTFLSGYESCMLVHGLIEQDVPDFKHFIGCFSTQIDWGLSYGWARSIYENVADHHQAFQTFFEVIQEFRKLYPKTIKFVKIEPNHPHPEKKFHCGDEFAVLRIKKIQIVTICPKSYSFYDSIILIKLKTVLFYLPL